MMIGLTIRCSSRPSFNQIWLGVDNSDGRSSADPISSNASTPQMPPHGERSKPFTTAISARMAPSVRPNFRSLGPVVTSSRLKSSCRVPVAISSLSVLLPAILHGHPARKLARCLALSGKAVFSEQAEQTVARQPLAVRRPMRARRAGIGLRPVETDKGNSLGLEMRHELVIACLHADDQLRAVRLDEVTDLADQPLGRIRYIDGRMHQIDEIIDDDAGQLGMPHQPVLLDIDLARFRNRLPFQDQGAVGGGREIW